MRIPKGKGFSVPFAVFDDNLSPHCLVLLIFLYSHSSFNGQCTLSYGAMMHGVKSSKDCVWKSIRALRKKGWIYAIRKNGSKPATFILRAPNRMDPMKTQLKPGKLVVL